MRTALKLLAGAGAVLALVAARPGTEFDMLTHLNGQEVRWVLQTAGHR